MERFEILSIVAGILGSQNERALKILLYQATKEATIDQIEAIEAARTDTANVLVTAAQCIVESARRSS
jgi:hypothetical protein